MTRMYSQMSQLGQHNAELVLKNIEANTKMADLGAHQQALEEGLAWVTSERDNGHLLVEKLGLLLLKRCSKAPQFGALHLGFPSLLLKRRPKALQLGSLRLGLLSLLLRRGPLDVTLASGPRQLL